MKKGITVAAGVDASTLVEEARRSERVAIGAR
jgi:hypothetical protein